MIDIEFGKSYKFFLNTLSSQSTISCQSLEFLDSHLSASFLWTNYVSTLISQMLNASHFPPSMAVYPLKALAVLFA